MIKSFRHKGLQSFFETGSRAGIRPDHAAKLRLILAALHAAESAEDLMPPPGWRLHALQGGYAGHWSLTVSGNWRVIFQFDGHDVALVDYVDYH
jgi:proteic killer suppression protein